MTQKTSTLTSLLDTSSASTGQKLIVALVGTALLTLSAKIKVPMIPVNMTLQPIALLLVGSALGLRVALLTVSLYLVEGAFGLPVFTDTPERGVGLAYMVGPTGGYLLGFLACAGVMGHLAEEGWGKELPLAFAAACLATLALYACGVTWLAILSGFETAINAGFVAFIPSMLVQTSLGALCLYLLKKD